MNIRPGRVPGNEGSPRSDAAGTRFLGLRAQQTQDSPANGEAGSAPAPKYLLPDNKYLLPDKCPECWRIGAERIGCNCLTADRPYQPYTIDAVWFLRWGGGPP